MVDVMVIKKMQNECCKQFNHQEVDQ